MTWKNEKEDEDEEEETLSRSIGSNSPASWSKGWSLWFPSPQTSHRSNWFRTRHRHRHHLNLRWRGRLGNWGRRSRSRGRKALLERAPLCIWGSFSCPAVETRTRVLTFGKGKGEERRKRWLFKGYQVVIFLRMERSTSRASRADWVG